MDEFLDGVEEITEETPAAEEILDNEEETQEEIQKETAAESEDGESHEEEQKVVVAGKEVPLSEALRLAGESVRLRESQGQLDPILKTLGDFATANGMSQEQMLGWMRKNQQSIAVSNKLAELQAKYPEAPENLLTEMAKTMAEKEINEANARAMENEQRIAKERNEPWVRFFQQYPMEVKDIPKEVFESIGKGLSPIEAYQEYKIKQLEMESTATKQNLKNKEKALGSMRGEGEAPIDPFLEGLSEF